MGSALSMEAEEGYEDEKNTAENLPRLRAAEG